MSDTRTLKVVIVGNGKSAQAALAATGAEGEAVGKKFEHVGHIMREAMLGVGLAVAGIAAESVHLASNFQKEMLLIQTQAGKSAGEVKKMSAAVLSLAGQTATAPVELAKGLYHLESAGLSGARAIKALRIAAEGAKVGGADLEDVTNALNSTIASGIPGAQNMQKAMGALNATVGAGDMRMQDLSEALGTGVLATVKGFGLSLNDVSAALATFGDNNIRGADAATQLRMAVLFMAKPAKGASKALGEIGLKTTDLAKAMAHGGLNQALTVLHDHLVKNGKTGAKAGQVLLDAFGHKAGTGLSILIGQFARFQTKVKEVKDGSTGFGKAWQATTKTFSYQLDQMKTNAEALGIKIGTVLIPPLSKVIKWLTGALASGMSKVAPAFAKLKSFFSGFGTGAAAGGLTKFGKTLLDLGKTIYGISSKIAADFVPTFKTLGRVFVSDIIPAATAVAQSLGKFAKDVLPVILPYAKQLSQVLGKAFKDIGRTIKTDVVPAFQKFLPVIEPVAKFLLKMFGGAVVGLIKGAVQVIKGALNVISGALKIFTGLFTGNWSKMWQGVKQLASGVWNMILGGLKVWWNAGILNLFRKGALMLTKGIWEKLWKQVGKLAEDGLGLAKKIIKAALDWVLKLFKTGFSAYVKVVKLEFKAIELAIKEAMMAAKTVIEAILKGITALFKNSWRVLKGLTVGAWKGLKAAIETAVKDILGFVKSIPGKIVSALGNLGGLLVDAGKNIIKGFLKGITSAFGDVKHTLGHLTKLIPSWKGPADVDATLLYGAGQLVITGFVKGLEDTYGDVYDSLGSLTKGLGLSLKDMNAAATRATQSDQDKTKADRDAAKAAYEHTLKVKELAKAAMDAAEKIHKGASKQVTAYKHAVTAARNAAKQVQAAQAALADAVYQQQEQEAQTAVDTVSSTLQTIVDRAKSLKDSFAQTVTDGTDLATLFQGQGDDAINTVDQVITALQGKLTDANTFAQMLGDLAHKGVSEGLIQQIASAGPQMGLAIAKALENATPQAIQKLNDLTKSLGDVATTGMDKLANQLYAPGAQALANYLAGIKSKFPELRSTVADIMAMVQQVLGGVKTINAAKTKVATKGAGRKLPGMAMGGTVAASGLSWVGENGPELLDLPRGASVIPLGASNGPHFGDVHITVQANTVDRDSLPAIKQAVKEVLSDVVRESRAGKR